MTFAVTSVSPRRIVPVDHDNGGYKRRSRPERHRGVPQWPAISTTRPRRVATPGSLSSKLRPKWRCRHRLSSRSARGDPEGRILYALVGPDVAGVVADVDAGLGGYAASCWVCRSSAISCPISLPAIWCADPDGRGADSYREEVAVCHLGSAGAGRPPGD